MSTIEKVGKAIDALGIEQYILRADGPIDSEEKFNNSFKKITGVDENGNAIEESDPSKFGVTWNLWQMQYWAPEGGAALSKDNYCMIDSSDEEEGSEEEEKHEAQIIQSYQDCIQTVQTN